MLHAHTGGGRRGVGNKGRGNTANLGRGQLTTNGLNKFTLFTAPNKSWKGERRELKGMNGKRMERSQHNIEVVLNWQ